MLAGAKNFASKRAPYKRPYSSRTLSGSRLRALKFPLLCTPLCTRSVPSSPVIADSCGKSTTSFVVWSEWQDLNDPLVPNEIGYRRPRLVLPRLLNWLKIFRRKVSPLPTDRRLRFP